jgi:hypothetical protein
VAQPTDHTFVDDILGVASALGYALMVLALPPAFYAVIGIVNEYRAFGIADDWFDCNSTLFVLIVGAPSLAIFGAAAVIHGVRFRRSPNLLIAMASAVVCVLVGSNFVYALTERLRPGFDQFCFGP